MGWTPFRAHQRIVGSLKLNGCMIGGWGCWGGFGGLPILRARPLSSPRPPGRGGSVCPGVAGRRDLPEGAVVAERILCPCEPDDVEKLLEGGAVDAVDLFVALRGG